MSDIFNADSVVSCFTQPCFTPNSVFSSFPPAFGYDGLSLLLGKDVSTLQADRSRARYKLPPACSTPESKAPIWLLSDVLAWLASYREPTTPAPIPVESTPPAPPRRRGPRTKVERLAPAAVKRGKK